MTSCTCEEGLIRDDDGIVIHRFPLWHDCAYVLARNGLIPEAEKRTNRRVFRRDSRQWSVAFSEEMDHLWAEIRMETPRRRR